MTGRMADAAAKPVVLVIDPDPGRRDVAVKAAARLYRVVDFADIEAAIGRTLSSPAAIVLSDRLPMHKNLQPIHILRHHPPFEYVPIILSSGNRKLDPLTMVPPPDAVIRSPIVKGELQETVSGLLNRGAEAGWASLPKTPRQALEKSRAAMGRIASLMQESGLVEYQMVTEACTPIVDVVQDSSYVHIFEGLRYHDNLVYVHSLRVATLLTMFGHTIGLDDEKLMVLAAGGLMLDSGKMALPGELLNKATALTDAERTSIQGHVGTAVRSLEGHADVPRSVISVISQHHERLDGSGYPKGLTGDQLNDLVRMASIVDVFAALTERRAYRTAISAEAALDTMADSMAAQLDQNLLKLFGSMLLAA